MKVPSVILKLHRSAPCLHASVLSRVGNVEEGGPFEQFDPHVTLYQNLRVISGAHWILKNKQTGRGLSKYQFKMKKMASPSAYHHETPDPSSAIENEYPRRIISSIDVSFTSDACTSSSHSIAGCPFQEGFCRVMEEEGRSPQIKERFSKNSELRVGLQRSNNIIN